MQPDAPSVAADRSVDGEPLITQLFLAIDDSVAAFSGLAGALELAVWSGGGGPDTRARPTTERVSLSDPATRSRLRDLLAAVEGARLLVVYPNPGIYLASKLDTADIARSLGDWCTETSAMLEVFRQHRRQILLIDGHAALSDAASFTMEVQARLGAMPDTASLEQTEAPSAPGGMVRVIADEAIRSDAVASRLAVELFASSLPLPPADGATLADILDEWRKPAGVPPEKLEEIEEENAWLLEQLHQVQEELEPYLLAGINPSALAAAQTEVARARRQLATVRAKLKDKSRQVDSIYASKSWKITAPLRKGLDIFGGGKH